ncbi:MAG: hypothetical protein COX57_05700 [Alphaproteobacteria bacterium CG_4_10_14_0_2_um_filter_63_37]|nr:MAG: hypothetical protein COX57_05700 [Alphaproteobacteria bacterium CG_4_10_14_0_2_um_filter_63_37]
MAKINQKVRTGNQVIVLIDGVAVGMAQSARLSSSYGLEAASGIGNIDPQEHVPTQGRYEVSMSRMTLVVDKMPSGVVPENGDAALTGYVFDLEVQDKATGEVLRKYLGCSYDSGDIDVQKHRITVSNARFLALSVSGVGLLN